MNGLAVAKGAPALYSGEQLSGKGVQHQAHHGLAILDKPHGNGGWPVAPNEIGGAVNGVDDPVPAGGHGVFLLLLGEKVGLRQQGGKLLNQKFLRGHVRLGDKIGVALLGVNLGAGDGLNQFPRLPDAVRRLPRKLFQFHRDPSFPGYLAPLL